MTISSTVRIAGPYIGSGAATVFPFAFKVFAAAEMQVAKLNTTSNVEIILVLNTDYTVQLNGDQNGTPGGTITLPAVLASGYNLTITSDIANLQPTDLTNQGGFYPEVITDALDRATIQIQQLDQNNRAIKIPLSDGVLDMTTPVVSARQGKYLAFDSLGLPVVSAGTGNDTALRTDLANATAVSAGSRLSGFRQTGTGATARTVDAKLKDTVSVKDFGAVGDGTTDDTAAIQAAINASFSVYVPTGTYMCANILMRSNLHIYGQSHNSILKLLPNALLASHNGSQVDSFGYYPGNVICSTLNHTGGIWFDNGVRACDPNNTTYIYENIIIENMTIDGNKANNQIGDLGANRSAMGACVSINQCKNVTVRNCNLINARLDGVLLGYSLHGGSDFCLLEGNYFSGNQRLSVAAMTGKYNSLIGNSGTISTGGTGVGGGGSVDIEANLSNEINYRHTIIGNRFSGSVSIASINDAISHDIIFCGNVWYGSLNLAGGGQTQRVIINGDTFIALSNTDDWLQRRGPTISLTNIDTTTITNCSISGFRNVFNSSNVPGCVDNIVVKGCAINAQAFGTLNRGYKVFIKDNSFYFTGSSDTESILLSNTLGGTALNQGQIEFIGNQFFGTSNTIFFRINRDATWTVADNDFVIFNNDFRITGHTNMFENMTSSTIENNRFSAWKPIKITGIDKFRFIDNEVTATSAENLFSNQSLFFTNIEIEENEFRNITVNVDRPKDCTISSNRFIDGKILILYSFTAAGVGRNHVCFNRMTSTSALANPFVVTTGTSFLIGDFSGNDQYKYNTFVGFGAGASIAATMVGAYDGTFA